MLGIRLGARETSGRSWFLPLQCQWDLLQNLLSVVLKTAKVMKIEERWRNCDTPEIKGVLQLNAMWDLDGSLDQKRDMSGKTGVCVLSHVRLFVTPWTVAHQAPLSMGFSRQEYWSGLPLPSPGDLPKPGIKPGSPAS